MPDAKRRLPLRKMVPTTKEVAMNFSYRLYGLIDCRAVYSTSMKSTTAVISHAPEIASRAKFFTKPRHQQTFYCLNDPFTLPTRALRQSFALPIALYLAIGR